MPLIKTNNRKGFVSANHISYTALTHQNSIALFVQTRLSQHLLDEFAGITRKDRFRKLNRAFKLVTLESADEEYAGYGVNPFNVKEIWDGSTKVEGRTQIVMTPFDDDTGTFGFSVLNVTQDIEEVKTALETMENQCRMM